MMRKQYLAAIILAVCVLCGCAQSTVIEKERLHVEAVSQELSQEYVVAEPEQEETTMKPMQFNGSYEALNQFSYRFFQENMEEENPVLSPVSAYTALSMVGLGAQDSTKEEFTAVLGDNTDITTICDNLMTTLSTTSENTTVTLANSAWINDNFTVYDSWLADMDAVMHSEVFHTNLSDPAIVGNVNEWVKRNTNGLIETMTDRPFDANTSLVLFNTIYFKAKWENSFDTEAVYEDAFYSEAGNELRTQIMHKESTMQYIANDFAEGVILPYRTVQDADGNFAFVALKPIEEEGTIRDVCEQLTDTVINDMIANQQMIQVNLKLPKYEISFDRELNQSLVNMGLQSAFDVASANFKGIGESSLGQSQNNLYIDLVRQKAKIIVDEEGTEAAAATGIMMRFNAARPEEAKDVWFDRPFLYMVMDMDKEIPLFIGIFDNPAGL